MTLLLDVHGYLGLRIELERETKSFGIDFAVRDLNGKGWGDCVVFGRDGIYQVEVKEAGEYIGNVDHLISQLKAQAPNADFTYLFIYGEEEPAANRQASFSLIRTSEVEKWKSPDGRDSGIERQYKRRLHRVNHDAQRKILWRCRQEGIQVVECRDLKELAYELCLFEQVATTVGTTFTRLIPEKFTLGTYPPEKEAFILSLMGLRPKWGGAEEVAAAVADWLECLNEPLTLAALARNLEFTREQHLLATQPLRSSLNKGARKMSIGPARVRGLKHTLGVSP